MVTDSRTFNTFRIIFAGLLNRLVVIIFPFINRTILIYTLGAEIAGLGSLFMSILSVLSLAELGFNTAIVYSMYDPIAKKDVKRIAELLTLYRRIYRIVGVIILILGLILVPILPYLIKGFDSDYINIYIVYLLYLVNTVISYFLFSYKESLLLSSQRQDISHFIRTFIMLMQYFLQSIILLIWKNYYLYLSMAIISTIAINIVIFIETNKRYPEYQCKNDNIIKVPVIMKKQVQSLLIAKVCDQVRNSLDSIILSAYLGLAIVAVYNNYYFIYSAINGITLTICNSLGASIGNSIAVESKEKNFMDLRKFSFMAMWIFGWFSVCLLCLYQPFMEIWVGKNLMLSNFNMVLFCIYFYFGNINNIRNQYINGNGLWPFLKLSYIIEAILNIILNLGLGKVFGVSGILIATIVTIIVNNFVWNTIILFKKYFGLGRLKVYLLDNLFWILCVFCTANITYFLCNCISNSGWIKLLLNAIFCIFIPNCIFWLLFHKTFLYREAKHFILFFVKKLKGEY